MPNNIYRHLNESETSGGNPVQYSFNFKNGSYYFVITVRDKSSFSAVGNLQRNMLEQCEAFCNAKQLPNDETMKRMNSVKRSVVIRSDNKRLDENTEAIFVNIKIDPEKLINAKDKSINTDSSDYKRVIKILNTLSRPPYNLPFNETEVSYVLNYFKKNILNVVGDIDEESLDRETTNLFFELCRRLNEEEVRKWLSNIKIEGDKYAIDYQGSLKNRLKMLAQALKYGDTPTYLATEKQWWDKGRRVVDFDMPYYGVTANAGRNSLKKELDAAAEQGLKPVYDENGRITQASRRAITNATNVGLMGSRRLTFSYNSPYYDIKATEPIPGFRDQFNELPSFSNNLDATFNSPALDLMSTLPSNNTQGNERTDALNKAFESDYKDVDDKYLAICKVAKKTPSLINNNDTSSKILECSKMIKGLLREKLKGFGEDQGRMIRGVNREDIVNIGAIILMGAIKLPMDNAPGINLGDEHKDMITALSVPVFQLSGKINREIQMVKSQKKPLSIDESLKLCSPFIIYEEWFNNAVNLILENEKK